MPKYSNNPEIEKTVIAFNDVYIQARGNFTTAINQNNADSFDTEAHQLGLVVEADQAQKALTSLPISFDSDESTIVSATNHRVNLNYPLSMAIF